MFTSKEAGSRFSGFGAPFLKAAQQFLKRLEEVGVRRCQEMVGCTPIPTWAPYGKSPNKALYFVRYLWVNKSREQNK